MKTALSLSLLFLLFPITEGQFLVCFCTGLCVLGILNSTIIGKCRVVIVLHPTAQLFRMLKTSTQLQPVHNLELYKSVMEDVALSVWWTLTLCSVHINQSCWVSKLNSSWLPNVTIRYQCNYLALYWAWTQGNVVRLFWHLVCRYKVGLVFSFARGCDKVMSSSSENSVW